MQNVNVLLQYMHCLKMKEDIKTVCHLSKSIWKTCDVFNAHSGPTQAILLSDWSMWKHMLLRPCAAVRID